MLIGIIALYKFTCSIDDVTFSLMVLFNILNTPQILVNVIVLIFGTFSLARNKRVYLRRITFDTTIVLSLREKISNDLSG